MLPLPHVGVGLSYRSRIRTETLRHIRELDFLEIVTDGFFRNVDGVRALRSLTTLIPHTLGLSVGSHVDPEYLARVKAVHDAADPPWHTDHIAFTHAGGRSLGHLAPVPHTREALDRIVDNIRIVQEDLHTPMAFENITMPFYWPHAEMEEHEFLGAIVRRTGCKLLLDLENVRVNAQNHARAARDFIDRLPMEAIAQLHLAGGAHTDDGTAHDTHSEPVSQETWALMEHVCEHVRPVAVVIERDGNFPPFAELLSEVRQARAILRGAA